MKKILITYLSTLPREKKPIIYISNDAGEISAAYTNEAGVRYLAACEDTKDIDLIIAVCSKEVMENKYSYADDKTTFEYFQGIVGEVMGGASISPVTSKGLGDVTGVFDEIKNIEADSEIYLDITGGFRDSAYTLALISRFLEFKGARVEKVIYSDICIGKPTGKITNYTDNFRLMSLINGVSEFANFGSSNSISEFFSHTQNSDIIALIESMRKFSDAITLGKISNLSENLSELSENIKRCEVNISNTPDERIFGEMLPIIRKKFFGETGETDYLSVIKWCLNNKLLQQAMTIYIEKIPEILFKHNWIEYLGDEKNKAADGNIRKKLAEGDYSPFYDNFIDLDDSILVRFRDAANKAARDHSSPITENIEGAEQAIIRYNTINKFLRRYNEKTNKGTFLENGLERARYLWGRKKLAMSDKWDGETREAFEILMDKSNCINLSMVNSNDFFNMLLRGKNFVPDQNETPGEKTLRKKITFLSDFEKNVKNKSDVWKVSADLESIKRIATAYVFLKQIRNEINHASDRGNLNKENREFFEAAGLRYEMNVNYLTRILREQVECFEKCLKEEEICL